MGPPQARSPRVRVMEMNPKLKLLLGFLAATGVLVAVLWGFFILFLGAL